MRVSIIATEFPPGPGGIGTHAYELARGLHDRGREVVVVASQDYAELREIDEFNRSQPFEVLRLGAGFGAIPPALSKSLRAYRHMRRWRPDIVIASGMRAVWLAALLNVRFSIPWLAVGHGTEFGVRGVLARRLNQWAFRKAARVICVSRYTWERMEAAGIQPTDGRVIHNGADDDFFHPLSEKVVRATRRRLGLGNAKVLVTVGNVTRRKGQDVMIRALPRILDRFPDTSYLMAGLATERVDFEALAASLGVAERVRFLGRIDSQELLEVLAAADVFVMTSRRTAEGDVEGFGIAVVEAALCGLPAVVSSGSGLTEAIVNGTTGIAVPQEDPDAVAQAVIRLLECDGRRKRMGESARQHATSCQTWRSKVAQYDEMLAAIAKGDTASNAREEAAR